MCPRDETKLDTGSGSHFDAAKVRTEAWHFVEEAHKELLAEKGRLSRLKVAPAAAPRLRANYRVLVAAGRLHILLDKYRDRLTASLLAGPRRSLTRLPPPRYCRCGCGLLIRYSDTGRPGEFARSACRKRAFRRRQAHVPEIAPRVQPGGRRKLAQRIEGWTFRRFQMANMLTHDLDLMRLVLPGREKATLAGVRKRLRSEREFAGLREAVLPKRSRFSPEYFARGLPPFGSTTRER